MHKEMKRREKKAHMNNRETATQKKQLKRHVVKHKHLYGTQWFIIIFRKTRH